QLGDLTYLEHTKQTLDEFAREWWERYATTELAPRTQKLYAQLWDRHILPRLGTQQLRQLTPNLVAGFQEDLRIAGVGEPTIRKALALLQSVCREAVTWGRITANPVKPVKKRSQHRTRSVRPLMPEAVERLRLYTSSERDATLISLLAYAGLRPSEALALTWADMGERTILVERALSLGEIKETKTRSTRTVKMTGSLKADLHKLKILNGIPNQDTPIIPAHDGGYWGDDDWRNWRRRVFQPAAKASGLDGIRPYDLRHSFVSLLIAEGRSIVEIARQAGHSPTMTLNTYGHVFDEHDGGLGRPAEEVIRDARIKTKRELRAPSVHPRTDPVGSEGDEALHFAELL
ncbi:MAG: site-specific integrase, partial [Actinobacteria bacterium]|nr:site-specific integrase [Actinomycetota bacterium]